MGKVGEEIDFANLVAFLSSDRSTIIKRTAINLEWVMSQVVCIKIIFIVRSFEIMP